MSRPARHRLTLVALIILLGLPLAAEAAPRRTVPNPFAWLWSLFSKEGCTLDPSGACTRRTAEEGCTLDPNGACAPRTTKEGCSLDPDGRCAPASQSTTEAGCSLDPSGHASENGCSLDPNGRL
jgi:hypothetical protein